jgi:hypothetical protein
MSLAYSAMVRSLENVLDAAMLRTALRAVKLLERFTKSDLMGSGS